MSKRFTGKHDANGRKIYEKDIILFEGKCYSVHFRDTAFYLSRDLYGVHVDYLCWQNLRMLHNCEVVGNIKDNPELMKNNLEYIE